MDNKEKNVEEELNLETKVKIISIAPWVTGAKRLTGGIAGDISIDPYGFAVVTREEAIAQVYGGNRLITGNDNIGSHATWYIDDKATRMELGFETEDTPQNVISLDRIKEAFKLKTMPAFSKHITNMVEIRAEKEFLLKSLDKVNSNEYDKISFCKDIETSMF